MSHSRRRRRRSRFLGALGSLCLFVLLSSPTHAESWWDTAVFYEVFVRSFHDFDGDGIGDLRGLTEKLDYLNDGDPATSDDLGVTGLWLMPICQSSSYHGYDVTDYYAIDSDYGTMEDFRAFLDAAHDRGIRVIVDLVLNHTSSEHPWFVASREPESDYRDWYVWSATNAGYLGPWGERVWHWGGTGYYYGVFWSGMPDLEYRNPEVSIQMFDVVRFWIDEIGVDGFRLDAIRHLIEAGRQQVDTLATHFWLKGFRAVSKGWNDEALLLGEVWDSPSAVSPFSDSEMDICFEFSLAEAILDGVHRMNAGTIETALQTVLNTYPPGRFATFLSNHDQERVMSRLAGSVPKAKLAASILLTLPGTPFIYYGEEIGMTGTKPDERIRTPMQWSEEEGGGFTAGAPWEPLQPDAADRTIASQSEDTASLLATYRRLIGLRTEHEAIRRGGTTLVETGHPALLSYLRTAQGETKWIVHNLSAFPARPSFLRAPGVAEPLRSVGGYLATDLLAGRNPFTVTLDSDGTIESGFTSLAPYQTIILELRPTVEGD